MNVPASYPESVGVFFKQIASSLNFLNFGGCLQNSRGCQVKNNPKDAPPAHFPRERQSCFAVALLCLGEDGKCAFTCWQCRDRDKARAQEGLSPTRSGIVPVRCGTELSLALDLAGRWQVWFLFFSMGRKSLFEEACGGAEPWSAGVTKPGLGSKEGFHLPWRPSESPGMSQGMLEGCLAQARSEKLNE